MGCLFAGCWDKRIHAFPLASHTNTAAGADGEQQPQQQQQQPAPPPLAAHTDFVKCVLTASLDGQPILLSGAADATIIIWDLQTRTPLHKLKGHVKALQDLAIDPFSLPEQGGAATSFELFSASSDREIRRWFISRTAAYELPESLEKPILAHETSVYKLRFDGSGDLWTASADKTAKHLIRDRGWEAETVLPHPDFVRDVVVAELAGVVVTACRDEEVRVWGLGSGELVCVYEGHFEEVMALGLVGRGWGVVSAGIDGTVRRWGLERGEMGRFREEVERERKGDGDGGGDGKGKGSGVLTTAEEDAELAELMEDSE